MVVGTRLPENKQLDGEVEQEDRVPEVAEGEAAAAEGDGEMYRIPEKVKEEEAETKVKEAQLVAGRAKAVPTALVVRRIWSFTASKNSTSVSRTAAGKGRSIGVLKPSGRHKLECRTISDRIIMIGPRLRLRGLYY